MRELFLALFNHDPGKSAGVDRRVANAITDVWKTTDVVKVSVSDNDGFYFFLSILKILCVRENIVDSWSILLLEHKTAINNDDVIIELYDGHVTADFFYTTKWNDANDVFLKLRNNIIFLSCVWSVLWSTMSSRICM